MPAPLPAICPVKFMSCTMMFDPPTSTSRIKDGFAKSGQRVIVVAGLPLGTPGATNMLRIAFVGTHAGED